jgi:transcriptional regulator with XRE-family HTH domain
MRDELVTWLTEELEKRSWSFRELGRKAGISHATISNIVSGQSKPGLDFCVSIAKAFNVPAETVLRRAGLLQARPDATPGLRELNFLYEQLDPPAQENILKMMRGYVREVQAGYAKKD